MSFQVKIQIYSNFFLPMKVWIGQDHPKSTRNWIFIASRTSFGFFLAFNYLGKRVLQVVVKVVQVEKEIPGGRFWKNVAKTLKTSDGVQGEGSSARSRLVWQGSQSTCPFPWFDFFKHEYHLSFNNSINFLLTRVSPFTRLPPSTTP